MKKLTRSVALITGLLLYAQFSYSQISFGPRAGLNMAVVAGVNTNAQFKPGLHLGAFARLRLNDKFAFQPEALFSMKGYTFKNSMWKESQSLNYIDIPLAFVFGKTQGLNVLIGAKPSILMGAKYKYEYSPNPEVVTDNKDSFKAFDMAFLTGIGFQSEGGLDVGFRFAFGLMPIFDNPNAVKVRNLNMQLTLGYAFGG